MSTRARRIRMIKAVLGAALALGLSAQILPAVAGGPVPTSPAPTYRSADLFLGVFMRSGEVAERLHGQSHPATKSADAAHKALLADIRRLHPGFLERFGRDIQSGDHLRVLRAVRGARRVISDVLETRLGYSLETLARLEEERKVHPLDEYTNTAAHVQQVVDTDSGVYSTVDLYKQNHLAVHYDIMIDIYTFLVSFLDPAEQRADSELETERFVDMIVTRLSNR